MQIPDRLTAMCRGVPERERWLAALPDRARDLEHRWSLSDVEPLASDEGSCAWVARAHHPLHGRVVLKLGMPHMEADHEIAGLRFWNGDPTAHLFEADEPANAMLLEPCEPGTHLGALSEWEQDAVIGAILQRLRRRPSVDAPFRTLRAMLDEWNSETLRDEARWLDGGLVRAGLELMGDLSRPSASDVLLATDLHAGNVLRAQRQPWLAIDPKPFLSDPAYDATQHLLQCEGRLIASASDTVAHVADLADLDRERVRLWAFARAAGEPRNDWSQSGIILARALAP